VCRWLKIAARIDDWAQAAAKFFCRRTLTGEPDLDTGSHYLREVTGIFRGISFLASIPCWGPEMKSTGEVMGVGDKPSARLRQKRSWQLDRKLPTQGDGVQSGVTDHDKRYVRRTRARKFVNMGFKLVRLLFTFRQPAT